ncbi:MAG: tRNA pseudouridine(55) synthase TruB [Acidobacteria bacterium]|nr:tRNA pseudouridine(55) synthase TruB [Spirochaetota bacterium]MBE3131611.1 tRNA pseudouridine(55) synthase TruB [Acidobacteriota bacterium]
MTDGIILLNKPPAATSFEALGEVKRRLGTRKVGHAGTLDPFAEGLLIALAGAYTRLASVASALEKEYIASVRFGEATDTLDPEGKRVAEGPVPDGESLRSVLEGFVGQISQVPPAFSAVHVDGRRAYEAARKGEQVSLAPRTVTIHSIQLLDFSGADAVLRVSCSRGTYIRSLARDIAERLGTCAYLRRLRRTRIGGFPVEQAVEPALFDPAVHLLPVAHFFATAGLGSAVLKEQWVEKALRGTPLSDLAFEEPLGADGTFGAFSPAGRLIAMAERRAGGWTYAAVFSEGGRT